MTDDDDQDWFDDERHDPFAEPVRRSWVTAMGAAVIVLGLLVWWVL